MRRNHLSTIGLLLTTGLIVAACGGGNEAADTTVAAPDTTVAASTTVPSTVAPATTAAEVETTTTVVAQPVMPLTGLPIVDESKANRPALVVKIDNHPKAWPQSGLNEADIVYEENVESWSRLAAVFQSQDADPVGPIRSGRTQDIDMLGSLNAPLFGWSGGNGNVTAAIRGSDLVELSPTSTGNRGFYRSTDRSAPHNLYNDTATLYEFVPVYAGPPPQQFTYRAEGEAFNGEPASGVDLKMDGGLNVNWTWDAGTASYLRFQRGNPHNDAELGQVNAANVVVLEVDYRPSPADARSPEAQTIGTGTAYVFTGGVLVRGTWNRADRLDPFTLTDEDGAVIPLTPGRTWIELARVGTATPLP
jgi:Protein of unknown function (DUF3048) N-terminal domain/Protein of unknown function (DUF3048) C-terminal domain